MRKTSREDMRLAHFMRTEGRSREEIAATLGVSIRTVDRLEERWSEGQGRPDMDGATMTEKGILAMMGAKFAQAEADLLCYRKMAEKEPENARWTNL
jgi:hypothetical protein